jgi:choline dehydrogenase-like flavoprotein
MGHEISTKNMNDLNTYDAIVVGSGISGGWAAKELCEGGLKTLVLERGRDVKHIVDYDTAGLHPWEFKHRLLNNSKEDAENSPVHSAHFNEANKHFFINDKDHPYIQENPFHWIRGYQVGGRSLTWGRQCYRLSPMDFEANLKDGAGVDWPIRYDEIEPWYEYVEKFVGVSGENANLPQLPDSIYLPPIPMNCVESRFAEEVNNVFEDRKVIPIRLANLTEKKNGRGPCQYRNSCSRGCVNSGYFNSNTATLPAAEATGNMTLRPHSIVKEVLYDPSTKKATGVKIVDANTKEEITFYSKIIFINASTIATAAILLNSKSDSFPDGLGNTSKQIGHNLMDHIMNSGTIADYDGMEDSYYKGRNPGGIYIPRFHNLDHQEPSTFKRGYALMGGAYRESWQENSTPGFGAKFKQSLTTPGKWKIWIGARGEMLPDYHNRIELDGEQKDKWGLPLVKIFFNHGPNEHAIIEDIRIQTEDMLRKTGFSNIYSYRTERIPGAEVHEMGTARMGRDPETSVLNQHNQMHDVKNVFITDGSCMTSSASQNPSLTYMAITARACHYAVDQLNNGIL